MNLNGQNYGFHPQNPTSWGSRTLVRLPPIILKATHRRGGTANDFVAHMLAAFPSYFTNFAGIGGKSDSYAGEICENCPTDASSRRKP